jgi:hypothetical protein
VHAATQNRIRLAPERSVPDEIGERGLHGLPIPPETGVVKAADSTRYCC